MLIKLSKIKWSLVFLLLFLFFCLPVIYDGNIVSIKVFVTHANIRGTVIIQIEDKYKASLNDVKRCYSMHIFDADCLSAVQSVIDIRKELEIAKTRQYNNQIEDLNREEHQLEIEKSKANTEKEEAKMQQQKKDEGAHWDVSKPRDYHTQQVCLQGTMWVGDHCAPVHKKDKDKEIMYPCPQRTVWIDGRCTSVREKNKQSWWKKWKKAFTTPIRIF